MSCATLSLAVPDSPEINLLLPEGTTRPLWKRLAFNLKESLFPEKLPPLQITSRPVAVGMLLGDYVSLPWYRTVFTNLGNVINPENLPALELQSRPVDVGELIGDQLSHGWWSSLLRNLAEINTTPPADPDRAMEEEYQALLAAEPGKSVPSSADDRTRRN